MPECSLLPCIHTLTQRLLHLYLLRVQHGYHSPALGIECFPLLICFYFLCVYEYSAYVCLCACGAHECVCLSWGLDIGV